MANIANCCNQYNDAIYITRIWVFQYDSLIFCRPMALFRKWHIMFTIKKDNFPQETLSLAFELRFYPSSDETFFKEFIKTNTF